MKKKVLDLSKKMLIITILSLIIFALTGCTLQEREAATELSPQNQMQEVDKDVIALVNGEKVYKEEFELLYEVMESTGIYEDLNELKANILKRLIEKKVEEQKIIELGITASDEEARELYHELFKDNELSFEEFVESSYDVEESDFFDVTKKAMKIDKLYEMNTLIGEKNLAPEEIIAAKTEYLNTLVKDAEIGVLEEYFDLISEIFEVNKLKVRN